MVANCTERRLQTLPKRLGSSAPTTVSGRSSPMLALIIADAYVPDKRWVSIQEQDSLCVKERTADRENVAYHLNPTLKKKMSFLIKFP